ncbi:MAG: GNAT family N-acetyltransferase [Dehalococcoidia bacterium]
MIQITCDCGPVFEAESEEALVQVMRRHVDEAHADLGLSDQSVRDYVAAAVRSGPPKPRVERLGSVEVRALTPERRDDFLSFFDYEAFAGNPAWADCYCMFFYFPPKDLAWGQRAAAENRSASAERIDCGEMGGYLAYVDGQPAGWCNAGPRQMYARIAQAEDRRVDDEEQIGSIVCFVIAPQYRRHGLARRLLDAAVEGFRREGLSIAEAYPARGAESDADNYYGPASLYAAAGFAPFREIEGHTMVRRTI